MSDEQIPTTKIAVFRKKEIRKAIHNNEWWFVIMDVVAALTDSAQPNGYIKDMRRRDAQLAKGWGQIATPLSIQTAGGIQKLNCANKEGIFRIIQSIPSPKAEPFKLWLAKVGYERVQEIEDPEIATKRTRALYKAKGYSEDWIEKRMRGIAIREELTDEWKRHGVRENKEYEILTAEISKAAFGLTPSQYKKLKAISKNVIARSEATKQSSLLPQKRDCFAALAMTKRIFRGCLKGLKRENLRDHMTDLELIFSMLGEASTTHITKAEHPKGFIENKSVARRGGNVAGVARKKLEQETRRKVISRENYLQSPQSKKQKELK